MLMVAENWYSDQTSMLLNLIKTIDLSIFKNDEVLISLTKSLYHRYRAPLLPLQKIMKGDRTNLQYNKILVVKLSLVWYYYKTLSFIACVSSLPYYENSFLLWTTGGL